MVRTASNSKNLLKHDKPGGLPSGYPHAASLKQAQNQCQAKLNLESGGHDAIIKHLNEKHEKERLRWSKEIADIHTELLQKTTVHKGELDNANAKILAEKKKRRLDNEQATADKGLMAADIAYLRTWLDEMNDELSEAKFATKQALRDKKDAMAARKYANSVATKRMAMLKDLKIHVNELSNNLADESQQRANLERMSSIKLEIKRQRGVGRKGGSGKWPVKVVLLICELLVNGTPPSAVPKNIRTFSAAMTGETQDQPPSVDFVRKCRVVVQNLNEMLAAYRLSKEAKWHQLFTDVTSLGLCTTN